MNTLKVELKEAERFLKDGWFLVEKKEGDKWFLGIQLMETTGSFGNGDFESKNKIVINEPVQLVSESGKKLCKNCLHEIDEDGAGVQHVFYNPKSEMIKGQCMDTWSKKCICSCSKPEPLVVVPKKIEDAGKNWKVKK